jgi:hypothetical protein
MDEVLFQGKGTVYVLYQLCYNPSLTDRRRKRLEFWPLKASIQGVFKRIQAIPRH